MRRRRLSITSRTALVPLTDPAWEARTRALPPGGTTCDAGYVALHHHYDSYKTVRPLAATPRRPAAVQLTVGLPGAAVSAVRLALASRREAGDVVGTARTAYGATRGTAGGAGVGGRQLLRAGR